MMSRSNVEGLNDQVSISPTFYEQHYCMKVFDQLLSTNSSFLARKNIGEKAACKILLKLT